jgi:ComF family protein
VLLWFVGSLSVDPCSQYHHYDEYEAANHPFLHTYCKLVVKRTKSNKDFGARNIYRKYHIFEYVSRCGVIDAKNIAEDFVNLFLPRLCLACRGHLVRGERILCTECLLSMARTDFHQKRDNLLEQAFWGRCLIERAAAYSVYNRGSRIRKLIHSLKYEGRTDIGRILGEMYGAVLAESGFMDGIDLIIPVPLHPARQRKRGYNQSECIARGLTGSTGVAYRSDIMIRAEGGGSQTSRGRYERWENVEGLFRVRKPDQISGRHILVVDDVITTGSTIEACVIALQSAGNVRVSVAALAAAQKLSL